MRADQLEPPLEPFAEAGRDHRPVQDVLGGIADRSVRRGLREPGHEVVVDVPMDDRRAERRAALAGGPETAEQRAFHGEVQVGIGHHDERVLAAELEARRLEVTAAQLPDPASHLGRAGEPDLVEHVALQGAFDALERMRSVGQHELEGSSGEPGVQDQLGERLGRSGRVLGGFPDHRVPAQQGGHDVPRGDGDGEVARGDDPRDPHGYAEREELLVRHLGRDRLAVEAAALAEEEGAGVDDLLHLAARLADRLPDLTGDQPGEGLGVVFHEPAELLDRPASDRSGDRGPGRLRRLRPPAGVEEGGRVAELCLDDRLLQAGRVQRS